MYNVMYDIYIHCEMITKIKLIDIAITSHSYVCLSVCVCVKISSIQHSNIDYTHHAYIRPPEFIHLAHPNLCTI